MHLPDKQQTEKQWLDELLKFNLWLQIGKIKLLSKYASKFLNDVTFTLNSTYPCNLHNCTRHNVFQMHDLHKLHRCVLTQMECL